MRTLDEPAIAEIAGASGYWYVATAYSKHPGGLEAAHDMACRATAALWAKGVMAFSPIAHTHPIAIKCSIDPRAHDLWMRIDRPMMEGAEGIIVLLSRGWQDSIGVAAEIEFFRESCLPIYGMEWDE